MEKELADNQLRIVDLHLSIRDERGIDVGVCRAFCYMYVHGFGEKRLLVLCKKIEDSGGLEPDKRGKHEKHYSVGEDVKELVREHIRSFPARHSHYSRQDNAEKVYLSPELSIAKLPSMSTPPYQTYPA